jgi:pimeloyl-ACP methyl ester carboxylesterase
MMPMTMPVVGMVVMLMSLVGMSSDGPITGHGSPCVPAEEWMLGLPMVARSRAWRLDLGYEETPPADYTLDTIVRDIAHVIRTEIGKADLVIGVSFGGFVAQRFAAEHPDLVGRLVLLVSGHRFSEAGWEAMERQFQALESGDFHALATDNVLLFRRPWYNWLVRLKLWKDRGRLASEFKDPKLIIRSYRSLFAEDFARNPDFARRITAPTLVVGGTSDQFFDTRVFEETAEMIPGARVALFEGEIHMLPIERSGDVAGAVQAFLAASRRAAPVQAQQG